MMIKKIHKYILFVGLIILIPNQSLANNAPIIQPGAPGENSKILDPSLASNIAGASYVEADVKFLEGMITHHKQAIVMSKLAKKRTNNKTILDLAKRIDVSQEDEINFMESWLKSRKEIKTNTPHIHHMHMEMAGMASPEQLIELENSKSTNFDRLFLQLMIAHHDGALEMVKELKKYPGSANEPLLNERGSARLFDFCVRASLSDKLRSLSSI